MNRTIKEIISNHISIGRSLLVVCLFLLLAPPCSAQKFLSKPKPHYHKQHIRHKSRQSSYRRTHQQSYYTHKTNYNYRSKPIQRNKKEHNIEEDILSSMPDSSKYRVKPPVSHTRMKREIYYRSYRNILFPIDSCLKTEEKIITNKNKSK